MATRLTLVPLALAAGAALALTGCSSTSPSPAGSPSVSATPVAASDLPALDADAPAPGQVLADESEAEAARAAGRGVYHASDDTLIAIDPAAELPEAVTVDLRSALSLMSSPPATDAEEEAQSLALVSALDAVNQSGKQAVFLIPGFTIAQDGTSTAMTVVVTEVEDFLTEGTDPVFTTPTQARTYVTKRLAQYEEPATFAVVDVTGWA